MVDDVQDKPAKLKPVERLDATTKAASEIIDRERTARDAKTARLRTARLAKESDDKAAARKGA